MTSTRALIREARERAARVRGDLAFLEAPQSGRLLEEQLADALEARLDQQKQLLAIKKAANFYVDTVQNGARTDCSAFDLWHALGRGDEYGKPAGRG